MFFFVCNFAVFVVYVFYFCCLGLVMIMVQLRGDCFVIYVCFPDDFRARVVCALKLNWTVCTLFIDLVLTYFLAYHIRDVVIRIANILQYEMLNVLITYYLQWNLCADIIANILKYELLIVLITYTLQWDLCADIDSFSLSPSPQIRSSYFLACHIRGVKSAMSRCLEDPW